MSFTAEDELKIWEKLVGDEIALEGCTCDDEEREPDSEEAGTCLACRIQVVINTLTGEGRYSHKFVPGFDRDRVMNCQICQRPQLEAGSRHLKHGELVLLRAP